MYITENYSFPPLGPPLYMGGTIINHMLYADDICIVSLSSSGLQQLLNICNDYCELQDLTFNAKQSMCIMYFSIDIDKHCGLPVIYLGNVYVNL